MRELNKYIRWGLLFNGMFLLGNVVRLPQVVSGVFCGLGICLCFMGMLYEKNKLENIKNYKKVLVRRIIEKKENILK